jgi:hypothetical protein
MVSRAKPLRDAVKNRFYPFAEQQGFARRRSAHPLFADFRRERHGKVQLFDIQWEKYHRPCFVLNFGETQPGDLELNGTRIAAEEVGPAHCPLRGRLQRYRGGSLSCWFRLRKPWSGVLTSGTWNYAPDEVVEELVQAFRELEAWWETKTEGPHIDLF